MAFTVVDQNNNEINLGDQFTVCSETGYTDNRLRTIDKLEVTPVQTKVWAGNEWWYPCNIKKHTPPAKKRVERTFAELHALNCAGVVWCLGNDKLISFPSIQKTAGDKSIYIYRDIVDNWEFCRNIDADEPVWECAKYKEVDA
jgi:hypothetical protein